MKQSKGVAWYDVNGSGPVRDLFVLLDPPYTAWHLSYAAIGAALAPVLNWALLGWTVLAFFLAMGIAGHVLDELNGRPLRTRINQYVLEVVAGLALGGALTIGIYVGLKETMWLLPCMLGGMFIVLAYNLEWANGFFHEDRWFGLAWGAFPVFTAYLAQAHSVTGPVVWLALFAYFSSMAQRKLSLQARFWRRKVFGAQIAYLLNGDPVSVPPKSMSKEALIQPVDLALKYFNGAVVALAIGVLIFRLMEV